MTWRAWTLMGVISSLWLGTVGLFLYVPPSPYEPLGGDRVIPTTVRAGDHIAIRRHYRMTRDDTMTVTRSMVAGSCPRACEIIDLPSSSIVQTAGIYERTRDHLIPTTASPGRWILRFAVHWEDRLGRTITMPMPELEIEVVE